MTALKKDNAELAPQVKFGAERLRLMEAELQAFTSAEQEESLASQIRPPEKPKNSQTERIEKIIEFMGDAPQNQLVRVEDGGMEFLRLWEPFHFSEGIDTLHPASFGTLRSLIEVLEGEEAQLLIHGHANRVTDEKSSWKLSANRAISVADLIGSIKGRDGLPIVPGNRITVSAHGHHRPLENGDAKWNRRVEVSIRLLR